MTLLVVGANLMDKPVLQNAKSFYKRTHGEGASTISYNRSVRRLLALSLLLLFSFPLVSPLLALSTNSDANLPACCRRNGVHHCQMKAQRPDASAHQLTVSTISTKCPFYPRPATLVRHNDARLHAGTRLLAESINHSTVKAPPCAHVRIALDTAWQKRGPPAYLS
ncbi:hypothetical protein [Edaphobacter sp.]|uniref:hypothetical protein n=1 Tax=Edaphobacter sp. TaxID=1934404 RepID=UPI002D7FE6FB|nr:hypothetical protein [Edaphobacter sp.]